MKNNSLVVDFKSQLGKAGIKTSDPRIDDKLLRDNDLESIRNLGIVKRSLNGQNILPDFQGFTKEIDEIFQKIKSNREGKVASYIPQLANVNPELFGVSICTVDGQQFSCGDHAKKFSIQSTHKPINYAIAIEELGLDLVHKHVGKEPSGASFNALTLNPSGLPHNPLINSGAIMMASLILRDHNAADKYDCILDVYKKLVGSHRPSFNNAVYLSERDTADRNFALSYFMRENQAFPTKTNIHDVLDFYFQCCSIESSADDMAKIAATFANSGVNPFTNEKVFESKTVKSCLTMMNMCGMYDFSGEFAFSIGLPAKSGVSGAIWIVVPNVMGICIYSPPLDGNGNSVKGIEFAKELIKRFNFHAFDSLNHELDGKKDPRRKKYETQATEVMELIFAASAGDIHEVKKIVAAGISVNDSDYDGRTALHLAASENRLEVADFLLKNGANLYAKDRWGGTPHSDAKKAKNREMLELVSPKQKSNGQIKD